MKVKIQKCETAHSIWSNLSTSISTSLRIRFNIKHVLPWGLGVCYWYLRNGNEGDGLEISTVWSYLQGKGEGCSLQAYILLTSLQLVLTPVAPLENSCVTDIKEKAKSTTRNGPALAFQILYPSRPTTFILQANTFLLHRKVDKIPITVVKLILMMMIMTYY